MSKNTALGAPGTDRKNLYSEITDKIITELEQGRVPWVQPWESANATASLTMPNNAATGRRYSGINVVILWGAVIDRGFSSQSWLTFRQALALGGKGRRTHRRLLGRQPQGAADRLQARLDPPRQSSTVQTQ